MLLEQAAGIALTRPLPDVSKPPFAGLDPEPGLAQLVVFLLAIDLHDHKTPPGYPSHDSNPRTDRA